MSWTVPVALFGWPFVVVLLFATLRPRRAVIVAFLFAWLFLPVAGYEFEGLPGYTKMEATSYGALLGLLLFDASRVVRFRLSLIDLPMLAWCATPVLTAVTNGLGVYEGLSFAFETTVSWGIPYFIGRLYLTDLDALRDLAIGIFVGGLIYVPLCLFEIRMSPRLHIWVYGFFQHDWRQVHRGGGWRPTVFMQHGLAVGMWMATAALIGWWMWRAGVVKRLCNVPMAYLVLPVTITAILCKSFGAVILLVLGVTSMTLTRQMRTTATAIAVIALPTLYMGFRMTGSWDGSHLVDAAAMVSDARADSLQYRLDAEDILIAHALRQPLLGWGRYGRNRPADMGHQAKNVATDGFWIITLGQRGLIGLSALTLALLLPAVRFLRSLPVESWSRPHAAPAMVLAFVLVLFLVDSLVNAMLNPIYLLVAGGLAGGPVRRPRERLAAGLAHAMPLHRSAALALRNPGAIR